MNPNHYRAIKTAKELGYIYRFLDKYDVCYCEYGVGAEIITINGYVVADFPNHLDAEEFLDTLPKIGNNKK